MKLGNQSEDTSVLPTLELAVYSSPEPQVLAPAEVRVTPLCPCKKSL